MVLTQPHKSLTVFTGDFQAKPLANLVQWSFLHTSFLSLSIQIPEIKLTRWSTELDRNPRHRKGHVVLLRNIYRQEGTIKAQLKKSHRNHFYQQTAFLPTGVMTVAPLYLLKFSRSTVYLIKPTWKWAWPFLHSKLEECSMLRLFQILCFIFLLLLLLALGKMKRKLPIQIKTRVL